jgi:hypothetical protein
MNNQVGTSDLETAIAVTGLASSFSKGAVFHVISTVHREDIGDFYQTTILKRSLSGRADVTRSEVVLPNTGDVSNASRV